jgi:hypothetical protein
MRIDSVSWSRKTHTQERLEAARAIREEFPHIAILLLSAHIEVEHARGLLAVLGPRVREMLALTAEVRSNTGIARHLWVT